MKKSQGKSSKGFYLALALCIIGIGVAVYLGVSSMMEQLTQDETQNLEQPQSSQSDWSYPKTENVNKTESEVPVIEEETPSIAEEVPVTVEPAQPVATPTTLQFMMPVEGEVTNSFSNGELVKSKTLNEWRTHDGLDISAAADTPVKAAADGIIDSVTEDPMWGVCVTVSHNGNYVSYYNGLKPNVDVKVGQTVKIGDVIGAVGNTAEIELAEVSHLHFAVKQDGEWIDPAGLMG